METHLGILSLIPPFIAIFLAIWTRKVYLSLSIGIFAAYFLLAGANPILGFIDSIEAVMAVFEDVGNVRTIVFCALVGGLIASIRYNGGVDGFILFLRKKLDQEQQRHFHPRKIELAAYLTGFLLFIETSISALTVGAIFQPIFDQKGISRDRLALIADTSSAPSSILIPLNAWGAFILSLIAAQQIEEPFQLLLQSMPYNFYPLVLIPMMLFIIWTGKHMGSLRVEAQHQALKMEELKELPKGNVLYLLVPIFIMIGTLPVMLVWDGYDSTIEPTSWIMFFVQSAGKASGTKAVLFAVLFALIVSMLLSFKVHGKRTNKTIEVVKEGIQELVPLAFLMVLAFAMGQACKDVQTSIFLASLIQEWISVSLLPMIVFIVSCVVAFSTGTSWGTFAIMIAISMPLAQETGAPVHLILAAVLSGGVFGDHCSPISDTTIISSLAAGTSLISHVRTQLPYALIGGSLAALLFLLSGFQVI